MFKQVKLWHMIPIAVGLHGLVFAIPVPPTDPIVEKQEKPVAITSIPKPSPTATLTPTPKAQLTPKPSVTPSAIPKPSPTATLSQSTPAPAPSPSPSLPPSSAPTVSPSPSPSPAPKDALQIDGATPGCNGREGCWQVLETQGRKIAGTLEKQLQNQGYQLTEKDLDEDTGMRVYQVEKSGTQPYYLHFVWSDRGTAYVRNPQILSRSELAALTNI
ncbi:hypothetical protein [Leptolyngbya sp. NIES-2104]|uniref:hypothetical protein n=1 Tax=Leptolyngbya sp. NIES-2104 TaxID=1552121 RepID=UPI0006EC8430|nr:hypothetical protein [Leptolyngbya sp. NIES-2104]GAP96062.1 hypothetical protein NIES2104_25910 [Leptolyngbya sp. NIES-2104]